MRKVKDEIAKRLKKAQENKENPFPVRPDPVSWGEIKLEIVIDALLKCGGEVGLCISDIAKEAGLTPKDIEGVIEQLVREEFLIEQTHWLIDVEGAAQYQLNLSQEEESEKSEDEQTEKEGETREITLATS